MPRTKPLYIHPSNETYKNLLEELIDIHSKISTGYTDGIREQISNLVKEVEELKNSTSNTDNAILEELKGAKGVYDTIDDRFLALDQYDILNHMQQVTTTKEYEYKDGLIWKEKVRGDFNYDAQYNYDSYGNIISEIKTDLNGVLISKKEYTYTEDGNVSSIKGFNTDDVMLLSNGLVDSEQDKRLDAIEAIDFVELGKVLDGWKLIEVAETVQELVTAVQHLMLHLPENIGYLIDTSEVFRRLDDIEKRIDESEIYYAFDVSSDKAIYNIPQEMVGKKFSVFMEGLLLEKDIDYVIKVDKVEFLLPLIDGFTVSFKN